MEPVVHRSDDAADAEAFVAEKITERFSLEFRRRTRIAPGHLYIERNEAIAWITHEQNDLRPAKLPLRYQVFAANSVPKITFGAMLK